MVSMLGFRRGGGAGEEREVVTSVKKCGVSCTYLDPQEYRSITEQCC